MPEIDDLFTRWDRTDSPGCAVGVYRAGDLVLTRSYGCASLEFAAPISDATLFRIGSVSKQFTGATVALLVVRGELDLDADVRALLPELHQIPDRFTVSQLVHHTAGVRDFHELRALTAIPSHRYNHLYFSEDDVLDLLSRQRALNFAPGERFMYSNSGYVLLACIVRRVTGRSLRQFANDEIFRPLGMIATRFQDDCTEVVPHKTTGYATSADGFVVDDTNIEVVGQGNALTTISDLAFWDGSFYDDPLGIADLMLRPGRLNNGDLAVGDAPYAFGLEIGEYRGRKLVGHDGATAGFRADLIRFPDHRLSVALLANVGSVISRRLTLAVARRFLGLEDESPSMSRAAADVGHASVPELPPNDEIAGIFIANNGFRLRLIAEDDGLVAEMQYSRYRVERLPDNWLRLPDLGIDCALDETGRLLVQSGGNTYALDRAHVVSPDARELQACAGRYFSDELATTYVVEGDGRRLRFTHRHAIPGVLEPDTDGSFLTAMGHRVRFVRDAAGTVKEMVIDNDRVCELRFVREG